MKIRRLSITQLRSITRLEWRPTGEDLAGWHVILGDNGAGKSSFLRALALALVGPREAIAARQEWDQWIAPNATRAQITIEVTKDGLADAFSGAGRTGNRRSYWAGLSISRKDGVANVQKIGYSGLLSSDRHIWGTGHGWFSAAYGPFRRFSGGDKDSERIFLTNPKLGAHISVFGESVALTESLIWLRDLHYKRLEGSIEGALISKMKVFINQEGFLPHDVKFEEVSSNGVEFRNPNGITLPVEALSDGYRSILSMTFELIRQLCRFFPENKVFSSDGTKIIAPGVVLIDEVDAHLHPTWQKRIGFWLTEHFPQIQFIVTTHSPLVCQAAVSGSIFHLVAANSQVPSKMLQGKELDRLLYGNILEAYSTEAFGTSQTRSAESQHMLERLAVLNNKEFFKDLNGPERKEQEHLRSIFATASNEMMVEVAG